MSERLIEAPPTITVETAHGPVEGRFFWGLNQQDAERFPGSVLGPGEFSSALGLPKAEREQAAQTLLFQEETGSSPIFEYRSESLHLRVLTGSATHTPVITSYVAKQGFDEPHMRAAYQAGLYPFYQKMFALPPSQENDLHIVEDCLATGETIAGLLHILQQETPLPTQRIRIDVAAATTIGLQYLHHEAKKNNWRLEINTGWLAYGLSEGVVQPDGSRAHANYITYPETVINQLTPDLRSYLHNQAWEDGTMYVVGDMGDAGKILPPGFNENNPWNAFRTDSHEPRCFEKDRPLSPQPLRPDQTVRAFLANGGYLTRAYWRHYLASYHLQNPENELITQAKRVWTSSGECGIVVGHLPEVA